ncbi:myosin-2 [[Candida] jaroonii]|uniref:Myosin-2 n=1 Tax=[Candida] jaroonii TaxID=467808 RepID=A0ACA9Y893_9ASCO|nr:myosin-2 [[Candida] jaroonii]
MSVYDVGTRCWYPDDKLGWIGTTVKSCKLNNNQYDIQLKNDDDDNVFDVTTKSIEEEDSKFPLRNPPILEASEDLTSLSYLNEPAVLHAIKLRYSQLNIYTYSGIVLIATNPFQKIDQLYSQDIIQAYSGKRRGELDPHLFAIAEDAYRCMKLDGNNQTIVVSGESGAGKTVSAKYIMRYFASVENDKSDNGDMSDVEKQILATNPIMEAFGNAKTTRNDNSSRFGKYLEILFDDKTSIIGARIRTYLLERSRLVFQPKNERNYHIFYQLLSGLNNDDKLKLNLSNPDDYNYTSQGDASIIEGTDDVKEFQITQEALSLIGINDDKQFEIYKILAALLHIGNIEIAPSRNDAHLSSDEPNLIKACDLLGIDAMNFSKWCVKKQITTRSEKITSNLNYKQALVARDSFAKYIYSALFDWLVDYINADLCPPEVSDKVNSFIGVLDIYGFEHFEKNSFEQFCINYANEKLQQEFNQHVFKLEQEEYVKEEIEWSFIDFSDNQPCINLIENKLGILSLLDEESRLPSGSDQSLIEKMYQTLNKEPTNKVFKKPRFGQSKFIVAHYALDVSYDIEGFIEKNRDTVGEGHLEVLKNSSNDLLKEVLEIIDKNANALQLTGAKKSIASKKPTLGSIFKNSLIELMKTINSTNVHYIRCIKPNELKKAWEFDSLMVLSQLRACGVLETIRISCAGFPTRWTYLEFADRYHILVKSDDWIEVMKNSLNVDANGKNKELSHLCNQILETNQTDKMKYQLGNTKIFFKAGMLAHFEKLRSDKLFNSATMIQKNIRRFVVQKRYHEILSSHKQLQSLIRGRLARLRIKHERETTAAILIQTIVRGYQARKSLKESLDSIITLQKSIRGYQARQSMLTLKTEKSAIVLQKSWRGLNNRRSFIKQKKSAVLIQSLIRRKLAVGELKQLKVEAKSVNHFKEVSYKLENKVIELTQSLTAKIQDNKKLISEITSLKSQLEQSNNHHDMLKSKELEFKDKFNSQNDEHQTEINNLNEELLTIKNEYQSAESRIEQLTKEQNSLKQQVQDNLQDLKNAKDELLKRDTIEIDLKNNIDQLKNELSTLKSQPIVMPKLNAAKNRNINTKRHSSINSSNNNHMGDNRPVSVIAISNDEETNIDDINDELFRLLRNSRQLHREVVEGLLKNLKIPPAGVASDFTRKEILFPSRIIIIILSDMWRLGLTKESEEFLGEVLATIQVIVSNLKGDDVIPHGAFWLSNTHELYSFVSYAQQTILSNDTLSYEMSEEEFDEYLKLIAVVKEDFESLSYNIYNMWMKKMEKELERKAVSAVVLSQSLPGYMAPENSPFLAKVFSPANQYKMDDILSFFNSVYWSMKSYFIEHEVMNEVIIELLRFIDALCFNDLIMRRNFLSWKRGLQLNYNVTRLEEWCKGHEIQEASGYLCHLFQAAKLLQIKKNTPEDIEIIYEICYALKPSQIQKLISQYYVADYETPISPEVLQAVADRVKLSNDSTNQDLFELVSTDGYFNDPFRTVNLRPFSRVEAYVPAWLTLPIIRRIVELVAKNASVQESE